MSAPSSVLFICGMNSIRSPMAEVIARSVLPGNVFVQSAGLSEGERDHFVDCVLKEVNLDLGNRQSRLYNEMEDSFFDMIIALTPQAHERALQMARTSDVEVIFWPVEDPSLTKGTREQILNGYRNVRDFLTKRIKQQFLS